MKFAIFNVLLSDRCGCHQYWKAQKKCL